MMQYWEEPNRSVLRMPLEADGPAQITVECDSHHLMIRCGNDGAVIHRVALDPLSLPTRLEAIRHPAYFEVVVPKAATMPKFRASHVYFVSELSA